MTAPVNGPSLASAAWPVAGSLQRPASVAPSARPLRVGLLDNPLSGTNRNGAGPIHRAGDIESGLRRRVVRTPAEVAAALADFASDGVGLVVVNGGDGTVQAVLTAVLRDGRFDRPPLLAVLAAGTTSMIAGDVGLRGRPAAALARVLAWARDPARASAVVERPVLRVQAAHDAEPVFGMFFGTGAIYHAIHYCRARIHPWGARGPLGAGIALARYLLALVCGREIPVVPITSSIDGEPAGRGEHLLLFVTTLHRLVLGLRPFWGREPGALRFTAVAAGPRHVLRALPSLLRGRPSRHGTVEHGYVSRNAREVRLMLDGGCTLDGEMLTADSRRGPVVLADGGRAYFVRC